MIKSDGAASVEQAVGITHRCMKLKESAALRKCLKLQVVQQHKPLQTLSTWWPEVEATVALHFQHLVCLARPKLDFSTLILPASCMVHCRQLVNDFMNDNYHAPSQPSLSL